MRCEPVDANIGGEIILAKTEYNCTAHHRPLADCQRLAADVVEAGLALRDCAYQEIGTKVKEAAILFVAHRVALDAFEPPREEPK